MNWREIESVRVDGLDYKVKFVDPQTQVYADTLGSVDYRNPEIMLLKCDEKFEIQTFWHELIHIIDTNRLGHKLSETEVNTLGCAIFQILSDNTDLLFAMYLELCGLEFEPEEPKKKPKRKGK